MTELAPRFKVRVFVDFWNFTLSVKNLDAQLKIDWKKLGSVLSLEASQLIDPAAASEYEAMHVFGSYDPNKPEDAKLKNWFANSLDKYPGVHVTALQRQKRKGFPRCPKCRAEVAVCSVCHADMRGTEEKGVDTRIATDMISLAWANGYNVGVLVSSDRDFVPVVEFLQTKTIKVIHASFPPLGSELSQKCWGNVAVPSFIEKIRLAR